MQLGNSYLNVKLRCIMQIFLDMAVLVEAQGDLLDNIETQVHNSESWSIHFNHKTLAK